MEVWNGIWKKILLWNGIWNGRFLVWNGNEMEENCQYGINGKIVFHSIPYHALAAGAAAIRYWKLGRCSRHCQRYITLLVITFRITVVL